MTQPDTSDRELVMERVFNAPRELVWRAFTQAEHLTHWWGPAGWTLPVCTVNLRPGGEWLYCMRGPNGEESWGKAVYQEIKAPERLVYLDKFVDSAGNPLEGMPEMMITVTFEAVGNQTRIVSRTEFATAEQKESILAMGAVEGITQTFDRLDAYLASQH